MIDQKWWDTLSDEEKFQAYESIKATNKSHADALHAVTEHLLGKDWYCIAMDIYGCNEEIVATIKANYPNVNYSWSRTWKRITDAIWDHFKG